MFQTVFTFPLEEICSKQWKFSFPVLTLVSYIFYIYLPTYLHAYYLWESLFILKKISESFHSLF